jgi:hypothetical protein
VIKQNGIFLGTKLEPIVSKKENKSNQYVEMSPYGQMQKTKKTVLVIINVKFENRQLKLQL